MRALRFTKMQGLGNDFVVFDGVRQTVELSREEVRRIADRHFGIGCDQVLVVEQPTHSGIDFRYRIFNADGAEVEQCGNGARCFVRFVRDEGLTDKRALRVETRGGVIEPRLGADGEVSVDMGVPRFEPADVPFIASEPGPQHSFGVGGRRIDAIVLSMGNPHVVQFVPDVDAAPVTTEGPLLECDTRFPCGVNAGYVQVVDRANIRLRVWERGAGETLACGTGACAAAVAAILEREVASPVRVHTRGGALAIEWSGNGAAVVMTGPAVTVFQGEWVPQT